MDRVAGLRWEEVFSLLMLIPTIGFSVAFLLYNYFRHRLDHPEDTKFVVFDYDVNVADPQEHLNLEAPRQHSHVYNGPQTRWNNVSVDWIWITLGVAVIYVVLMVTMFLVSWHIPALRSALPK